MLLSKADSNRTSLGWLFLRRIISILPAYVKTEKTSSLCKERTTQSTMETPELLEYTSKVNERCIGHVIG